ncbi:hypothetical protein B2J93_5018 [Marssonina coronariae]|uniref:beta-galactosidase n=1 Tax=Diplocarpon coronariae TaxID=2795749 RepID=A0A218YSZ5_9HELO|nr:hypothetical protein B2J93_5018 [Marssonina coronariae]
MKSSTATRCHRDPHSTYDTPAEALTRDNEKARKLSLSGTWKFNVVKGSSDAPEDFYDPKFDAGNWGNILVPGMWQMQGYGKGPQSVYRSHRLSSAGFANLTIGSYTNVIYPFPVDPPHVPYGDDETGSYIRTFTLPKSFKDRQCRLRFQGVDFWVNAKANTLAVQVYQFCYGSYAEDQSTSFQVQTIFNADHQDAMLSVRVGLSANAQIDLKLLDESSDTLASASQSSPLKTVLEIPIQNLRQWAAETPYLYQLALSTPDCSIQQRVGFRSAELKDGIL